MQTKLNKKAYSGFTMAETVITIGVVAVLITAFLAVFAPATRGIRNAISAEEADRLAYSVETELVTLRGPAERTEYSTGFNKAFEWVNDSIRGEPFFVYKYRGELANTRGDGTLTPYTVPDGVAGKDFIIQPVIRQKSDGTLMAEDFEALEGRVYVVKLAQLIYTEDAQDYDDDGDTSEYVMIPNTDDDGNPLPISWRGWPTDYNNYPEAVLGFQAEFYAVPNSTYNYIQNTLDVDKLKNPIFTRNLAVRR